MYIQSKSYAANSQTCIFFSRWTRQTQLWQGRPRWWPRSPWGGRSAWGSWSSWPPWPPWVLWAGILQNAGGRAGWEEHKRALSGKRKCHHQVSASIYCLHGQLRKNKEWRRNTIKEEPFDPGFSKAFLTQSCTFSPKLYLATQAGTMVLTDNHRWCLLVLSPFGGKKGTCLFLLLFFNKEFLWFLLLPYLLPMCDVQWNNVSSATK